MTSPPIFIAVVGLVAKYRYRTKMILDIRDLWPESLKGVGVFNYRFIIYIFSRLEKLLYIKADKIIVNSQRFKDFIIGNYHIPLKKISLCQMPLAKKKSLRLNQVTGRSKSCMQEILAWLKMSPS
ncbi:hypothetical protein AAAC51_32420 [Priestia megaterium]